MFYMGCFILNNKEYDKDNDDKEYFSLSSIIHSIFHPRLYTDCSKIFLI